MTPVAPAQRVSRVQPHAVLFPCLLLVGLAAAILIRNAIGGAGVARSAPAGLVFAALLMGLTLLVSPRRPNARRRLGHRSLQRRPSPARAVGIGLAGAVVLCVPAAAAIVLEGRDFPARPADAFLGWAAVVTVVATAEEVFLRGALYRLLERFGLAVAIGVPAVAFAALHLPLYGWGALPLDFAVGVWLGALRAVDRKSVV